ncbi:MAG TPA: glycosyltransferase [Leeuwenhoekiella sp.]|nr:glycosyltransferase [Leeuwenhoekiella sp.]
MKLSYIVEVDPLVHSGIIKKINNQILIWRKQGHEVQTLILWPKASTSKATKYIEGRYFSNSLLDGLPQGFLNTYLTKITRIKQVKKALNTFNPDLVYIRQNIWYPGLPGVLRRYKTVMELNSVDYMEMEFYSNLKKKVYLWGKKRLLEVISGLVAVSPDILDHYKEYKIPQKVVSNGIDLSKFNIPKIPDHDQEQTNLIFVGSANMHWHGLEKIFALARKFPAYTIDIVGYERKDIAENIPPNVTFHGWVNSAQLKKLYQKSNLGIGSFGNHLVGKKTDSTLKVLEYLANGLPVILGHHDTDFHNADFLLKITDEEHKLLPSATIKAFIEKNKSRQVTHEELKKIDSRTKERERLLFFQELVHK